MGWAERGELQKCFQNDGETFLHNKNHHKSMPLCSSQMFLSIFGHTAVHSLPSAPAAGRIKLSHFSDSQDFHFTSLEWNDGDFTRRFKKENAIGSNPRRWQSFPEFEMKQYWITLPITFNQLSQQGRPAGMHESWQHQPCSSARWLALKSVP